MLKNVREIIAAQLIVAVVIEAISLWSYLSVCTIDAAVELIVLYQLLLLQWNGTFADRFYIVIFFYQQITGAPRFWWCAAADISHKLFSIS